MDIFYISPQERKISVPFRVPAPAQNLHSRVPKMLGTQSVGLQIQGRVSISVCTLSEIKLFFVTTPDSVAKPRLFWAAPAPGVKVLEPTSAPTYLGRLWLQEKIGGSRRLRLHTLKFSF